MSTIIQLDMSGNEVFSSNIASFANSKSEAKDLLGSVEKISDNLLIADSKNKKAIIYDMASQKIIWEYSSDRFVSDFHLVPQENFDFTISINGIPKSNIDFSIRSGTTITWKNESLSDIYIYSGHTTGETFLQNPDLGLYGKEFKSEILQNGDSFSYTFGVEGETYWFIYPFITDLSKESVGKITIQNNVINENDQYIILENDGLDSPFSSRVIKVNSYGEVVWSFGESYLVKPRDARPLLNGNVIIST